MYISEDENLENLEEELTQRFCSGIRFASTQAKNFRESLRGQL